MQKLTSTNSSAFFRKSNYNNLHLVLGFSEICTELKLVNMILFSNNPSFINHLWKHSHGPVWVEKISRRVHWCTSTLMYKQIMYKQLKLSTSNTT